MARSTLLNAAVLSMVARRAANCGGRATLLTIGFSGWVSACALDLDGTAPTFDAGLTDSANAAEIVPVLDASSPLYADAGPLHSPPLVDAHIDVDGQRPSPDAGEQACPLSGTYALQAAFNVQWLGTSLANIVPLVSAGSGEVGMVVIAHFKEAAGNVEADLRSCQSSVPEFEATLPQERYVVHFPDALWDSPDMPSWPASVSTCNRAGCAFSTTTVRALIGADLPSPADTWPTVPSAGSWPDHDADGRPGVSTVVVGPSSGTSNAYPPIDLLASRRTNSFGVGLRVTYAFIGERTTCDALNGATSVGVIDTRAVDCVATTSPASCSRGEIDFFNDNLPVWTVTSGRVHGDRIADDATCEDVRKHFGLAPI